MVRDKGVEASSRGYTFVAVVRNTRGEALEADGARSAGSKKMTSVEQLKGMDRFDTITAVYPRGKVSR